MSVWLKDLVKVLRQNGIPVQGMTYKYGRYAGKSWKDVGYNGLGYQEFRGIMWHHDSSPVGDSPSALDWCMYWAKDANGNDLTPAAAIWVDRRGKWFVYAAGRTNHAGLGSSPIAPNNTGNQFLLGIETDHTEGESWPKEQIDSLRKGTAVLMKHYGLDPKVALEFHRSYAPGRKTDPHGLDLGRERRRIARLMGVAKPSLIQSLLDKWGTR